MERLTQRLRTGEVLMASDYEEKYTEQEWISVLQDRVAAYEETGLTPGEVHSMQGEWSTMMAVLNSIGGGYTRLRELAEADKDGRVVVPPCEVGDIVYGFHGEKTILPMVAKWIETNTDGWCVAVQYAPMAPRFYRFSDFGKTVFLTREEAKKALEAMKDG